MLLENEADVAIVGEAGTAQEALEIVRQADPDVVQIDHGLPDRSGIEVSRVIKRDWPQVAVVALTIHEDEQYFFKMLQAGASGYVPKRAAPEELITAVRTAAAGEIYLYPSLAKLLVQDYLTSNHDVSTSFAEELSEREREVLAYLAEGTNTRDIAEALSISPKTVGRHRENIMRKLNLHSRAELVKYAIRKGLIQA
jgi:two-component system response regulator NreC